VETENFGGLPVGRNHAGAGNLLRNDASELRKTPGNLDMNNNLQEIATRAFIVKSGANRKNKKENNQWSGVRLPQKSSLAP
jgi:hypothetical protein